MPARHVSHDGEVLQALRYRKLGKRSAAIFAGMLSYKTGYRVYREHIHAFENGTRKMPDKLVEASAKLLDAPVELFPEYLSRQITPDMAAHPLVAWAIQKVRGLSAAEGRRIVTKQAHIKGDFHPLVVDMLRADGVRPVELSKAV